MILLVNAIRLQQECYEN